MAEISLQRALQTSVIAALQTSPATGVLNWVQAGAMLDKSGMSRIGPDKFPAAEVMLPTCAAQGRPLVADGLFQEQYSCKVFLYFTADQPIDADEAISDIADACRRSVSSYTSDLTDQMGYCGGKATMTHNGWINRGGNGKAYGVTFWFPLFVNTSEALDDGT